MLASGYHRQAIAGLKDDVPFINSSFENKGACGYLYVSSDRLDALNPLSRRLFGRPVELVYPAKDGKVLVGDSLPEGAKMLFSPRIRPESFYDRNAPLAGPAGLEDAVQKGLLRRATAEDAQAWVDAVMANSPKKDLPPIVGQGIPKPRSPDLYRAYVVLKPFVYPAGLYGGNSATFLIPKGVPKPEGNPGHSAVYDFNTLACRGGACGIR